MRSTPCPDVAEIRRSLPLAGGGHAGPCDECIAGCCRSFNIAVDGFDIVRIHRATGLPFGDFAELRWAEEPDPEHRIRLDPSIRRFHRLLLIRVDDPIEDHTLRCVFLSAGGDRVRCTIYAARPAPCRVYPTHVSAGAVATTGGRFCPPGAFRTETLDAPGLLREHAFRARQRIVHERLIDLWNGALFASGHARPPDAYFDFVLRAYDRLLAERPAWFEPPEGPRDPFAPAEIRGAVAEIVGALREIG